MLVVVMLASGYSRPAQGLGLPATNASLNQTGVWIKPEVFSKDKGRFLICFT